MIGGILTFCKKDSHGVWESNSSADGPWILVEPANKITLETLSAKLDAIDTKLKEVIKDGN